jgi:BirA family biotin operon repressor/biotin-[acetyl-CoA-carboxylase] ligase
MQEFEDLYERFEETGSLKDMMEAYNRVCVNQDRPVRVLDPKGEYTGIARGIDEHGVLLVEKEEGSLSRVSSGEVSVRGIYGYV